MSKSVIGNARSFSGEILSILTLTGIITIAISSYMIIYSNNIYKKIYGFASIFERKGAMKEKKIRRKYDSVLFGYNRIGFNIMQSLKKIKKSYLVVDFNPETINILNQRRNICLLENKDGKENCLDILYGDAYDSELLERLPFEKVELVISTINEFDVSSLLVKHVKRRNPNAIVIVIADTIEDTFELYGRGADYVLMPHLIGGQHMKELIEKHKTDVKKYAKEKKQHIFALNRRVSENRSLHKKTLKDKKKKVKKKSRTK